jgi:hypothetical protein
LFLVSGEAEVVVVVQMPSNLMTVDLNPDGGTWDFFPCLGAVFGLPSISGNLGNLKEVLPCVLFHS